MNVHVPFNYGIEDDDAPVARRPHIVHASAKEEAFQTLLDNFHSLYSQAFGPSYLILGLLSDEKLVSRTRTMGAATLSKYAPEAFVEVDWADTYKETFKSITLDGSKTTIHLNVTAAETGMRVEMSNYADQEAKEAMSEAMKQIWPSFNIDKPSETYVRHLTLKQFEELRIDVPNSVWDDITLEGYIEDPVKDIQKSVTFDYILTLKSNVSTSNEGRTPYGSTNLNYFQINVDCDLILSNDFVAWGTKSSNGRINKTLAYLWLMESYDTYATISETGSWPMRANDPKDTVARITAGEQRSKNFLPRTDSKGWSIDSDGNPFKWPVEYKGSRMNDYLFAVGQAIEVFESDRVPDYKKSGKPATLKQLIEMHTENMAGNTLIVDWINDRMVSLTRGKIRVDTIVGTIPLNTVTKYHWLNSNIQEHAMVLGQISAKIGHTARVEYNSARATMGYGTEPEPGTIAAGPSSVTSSMKDVDIMDAFTNLLVAGSNRTILLKHLAGIDLDELDLNPNPENDKRLCLKAKNILEWAAKNILNVKLLAGLQENNFNGWFLWIVETLGTFGSQSDYENMRRAAMAEVNKSRSKLEGNTLRVPNIQIREGSFEALMPHQADVLAVGESDPDVHIKDVATGGGKAILILIGVLQHLQRGRRRPLIKTQANLIPQMVQELNAITNGKVNIVSLRPEHLDLLFRQSNIRTVEEFIDWVKGMPPNTIFVNSYTDESSTRTFFDDLDLSPNYGLYEEYTNQYLHLIHMCEFEVIEYDESHTIKNANSSRSQTSVAVMSRANKKGLASGTILNNTVLDIHGQAQAVNPAIFGDINGMIGKYGVQKGGVILNRALSKALGEQWDNYVTVSTKRRHDWSFLLPDFKEHYAYSEMTDLQSEYYDLLMQEALIEVTKALDRVKSKGKNLDEEELESSIQMELQAHLAKVEQFLLAPDEVEAFVNWTRKPSGDDLISPKVRIADQIIRKHIDSGKEGKIIVTSYLKVGSKHFMRHSAFSNQFVHYIAGDLQAIQIFREDKDVIGLAADATSMRAGLNLQMASLICTLQPSWAPGDDEQLLARMYRPDPRGVYSRDSVDRYWILSRKFGGEATLDVTKVARMYSKGISNFMVSNRDNAKWLRVAGELQELPLIKMLPEVIFGFTNSDAQPYLDGWGAYRQWESEENTDNRVRLAVALEQKHGVTLLSPDNKILDIKKFLKYAMVKIEAAPDIVGSKKAYAPWVPFAEPADEYDLGLALVNDADITTGTLVMTEFGPGSVTGVKANSLKIRVAHGEVTLQRTAVARPVTEVGEKKLQDMMRQLGRYALFPPGIKAPAGLNSKLNPANAITPSTNLDPKETPAAKQKREVEQTEAEGEEIELQAAVVNGMPCLLSVTESDVFDTVDGWKNTTPFVQVTFASWKYAGEFLDRVALKFSVPAAHLDNLHASIETMKSGRSMKITSIPNPDLIRNFFLDTKRKLPTNKEKPVAKPYWITIDTKPRLVFDTSIHAPEVIRWLAGPAKKVNGVKTVQRNAGFWMRFFKNYRDMKNGTISMVKQLEKDGTAIFDKKAVQDQLIAAGTLYKEMKLNTAKE